MKRWKYISTDTQPRQVDGGITTANIRANLSHNIRIATAATSIRLLWCLAGVNWVEDAATTNMTSMDVQAGLRGYTGSTANGSGFVQVPLVSYVKEMLYISPAYTLSLSSGDYLHASVHARSTTGGKNVMGTRAITSAEGGETGDGTLAVKTSGETLTAGSNGAGFGPSGILARTDNPSVFFAGHSVPTGTGVATNAYYGAVAGAAANLGVCIWGRGGSNPSSPTTSAPWDISRLAPDICIVHWAINTLNSWADANTGADPTGGIGNLRDAMRTAVRRLKAHCRFVILATEWFTDVSAGGAIAAQRIAVRAAWNDYVRGTTTYSGTSCATYIGNDTYWDLAAIGENQPNLHTAMSPFTVTLHPTVSEHALIGASLGVSLSSGGGLYTYVTQSVNADLGYEEIVPPELFWGAAGAAGTAPTGWGYWVRTGAPAGNSLYIDGTGGLSAKSGAGTWDQCIIYTDNAVANTGMMEAVTGDVPTNVSTTDLTYYSIGFTPSTSLDGGATNASTGSQRPRYGYQVVIKYDKVTLWRRLINGGAATALYDITNTTLVAGDRLRVRITRGYTSGNNTFLLQVYVNGSSTPIHNSTVTDTSTPAGWEGNLYAYVGTAGSTASQFPVGKVWDSVALFSYNPVTIVSVTPTVADLEVIRGERRNFGALVIDNASNPAAGQIVTAAIAGLAGATVGGSSTTGANGVVEFTDTGGVYVPSTATIGDTGVITLTCGVITGEITITVVSAYSLGGATGNGEPEVTTTTTTTLTTSYQALATGDCKLQLREGVSARLHIGTSLPADGTDDYLEIVDTGVRKDPENYNVGAGATLYARKISSDTVKLSVMK